MGAKQKSKEKVYDTMDAQNMMIEITGIVVIIINVNELTVPGKRLRHTTHAYTRK